MSPSALSSLLTPSASGFRVDFGAALASIDDGADLGAAIEAVPSARPAPLGSMDMSALPSPLNSMGLKSSGKRKRGGAAPGGAPADFEAAAAMELAKVSSGATGGTSGSSLMPPPPASNSRRAEGAGGSKKGLTKPPGLGGLSVEVVHEGPIFDGGQMSISTLENAPLSAILGAFGFGLPTAGGPSSSAPFACALPPPPPSIPGAMPPLSVLGGPTTGTPLFGLSPASVRSFVAGKAALLDEALEAPLSNQPLSHSRKSPRLFTTIDLPAQW